LDTAKSFFTNTNKALHIHIHKGFWDSQAKKRDNTDAHEDDTLGAAAALD